MMSEQRTLGATDRPTRWHQGPLIRTERPRSLTIVAVLLAEPSVEITEQRRAAALRRTVDRSALPCLEGHHVVYRRPVGRTCPVTVPVHVAEAATGARAADVRQHRSALHVNEVHGFLDEGCRQPGVCGRQAGLTQRDQGASVAIDIGHQGGRSSGQGCILSVVDPPDGVTRKVLECAMNVRVIQGWSGLSTQRRTRP